MIKQVYLICPVRGCSEDVKKQMDEYVDNLEKGDYCVHYPPRDVDQSGTADEICQAHRDAMELTDEVHAWWDPDSKGSHFDFGMAYAFAILYNIKFVLANDPEQTPHKSYTNYFRELSEREE
jgi:hypothetical protein